MQTEHLNAAAQELANRLHEACAGQEAIVVNVALAAMIGRQAASGPRPDLAKFCAAIEDAAQDEFDACLREQEAERNRPPLRIPCPTCNGTESETPGRGHDNDKDTCRTCGGARTIPANTGMTPEASFNPKTGGAGV